MRCGQDVGGAMTELYLIGAACGAAILTWVLFAMADHTEL